MLSLIVDQLQKQILKSYGYADSFEMCKLCDTIKILLCFCFHPDQLNQWCKFCLSNGRCGKFGRKNCFENNHFLQYCFWRFYKIHILWNGQLSFSRIVFYFNLQTKTIGILSDLFSTISCTLWWLVYSLSETWLKLPEPTSLPAICQSHQVPCRQASWGQD